MCTFKDKSVILHYELCRLNKQKLDAFTVDWCKNYEFFLSIRESCGMEININL